MLAETTEAVQALSPAERVARLHELDARQRHDEAEIAALIAAIEHDGTHRVDGHASIAGFLRSELRWSSQQVCTRRRMARMVDSLPEVIEHLACGAIGVAQAQLFGRAHANPRCGDQLGQHTGWLLNKARVLEHDQFKIAIRTWEQLADSDGAHRDAAVNHANRGIAFSDLLGRRRQGIAAG